MNVNEAMRILTEKRLSAIDEAAAKTRLLHEKLPRVREIDALLEAIPLRVLSGEGTDALRAETEALNDERARLLLENGFSSSYDAPVFECATCRDGGYIGLKLCDCVKKLLASAKYAESSLAAGLADKDFKGFSLDYYEAGSVRKAMESIKNGCESYANGFPQDGCGLLFMGGTGLGKTHLSAAIANTVAKKGFRTVYESAQQICDTYDAVRFGKKDEAEKKKFESCDLLIIDDLGAECITQYSVSAFASLLNTRIVNGRQTIISTNLSPASIRKIYGERVLSRLLGEFRVLQFLGKDVRMQKIMGKSE